MKGYSEQRGVLSQVIFDAETGRFVQCDIAHDFEQFLESKPEYPPDASVIELQDRKELRNATSLSRKSRQAVMQILKMQRVG